MKEFFKKFGIFIGLGIAVVTSIVLIIIAFTRPVNSTKEIDDKVYLNIQFETKDDIIDMNITANKVVDLKIKYTIDDVETIEEIKVLAVEPEEEGKQETFRGKYSFERKQEFYIVKNLILTFNEEELYSRENTTIPALVSEDNQNSPSDSTELTGKLIEDGLDNLQIAFYKETEIIDSYGYIVECDDKKVEDDSVVYKNGILNISKLAYKSGEHKLHIFVSKGTNNGEFSYTFNVSNELFIKNPKLEIVGEYYKGASHININFSIDGLDDIIESLTINGTTYSEFDYNLDDVNSRITYTTVIEVPADVEEPAVKIEKISHKYGDYNVEISKEIQLKEISFEAKIEYSNSVYFEGDEKKIEIVIGNPEQVQVKGFILNDKLYECDSNEEIIRINVISSADVTTDKLTEIKYMMYENMVSEKISIENQTTVLSKVTEWSYNEHVMIGNPIILSVTLNKNISDAEVNFSGYVNLEEFNDQTTPYEVKDNVINIDFSNFASSTKELNIVFSGINIAYGTSSYSIAVQDTTQLYYSDLVYNIYNFIYYEENYKLTFNVQTFNNTQVKKITYKLYDENGNLLKDVSAPSVVYSEESFDYVTYYVLSIPSNAKYIEIVSIDCSNGEEPIQITQWLLKGQKQEIQKYSSVSE